MRTLGYEVVQSSSANQNGRTGWVGKEGIVRGSLGIIAKNRNFMRRVYVCS